MDRLQALSSYLKAPVSQFYKFTALAEKPPDPLLEEMIQAFNKLSNEDKLNEK